MFFKNKNKTIKKRITVKPIKQLIYTPTSNFEIRLKLYYTIFMKVWNLRYSSDPICFPIPLL
jgi:hypothetical protein